jgi:ubiquinone/menaquinone biosynthesis C-methylase UbiE
MDNKTTSRWRKAQSYEKAWWQAHVEQLDLSFYKAYADDLINELDGFFKIEPATRILEIGSGAAGILTFLESTHRHAIDPLEYFYAKVEKFARFRDNTITYQTAKAEALPFPDNSFDLIIIDNVIDHCENVEAVFAEMRRVLNLSGIVYLRLNTYNGWGKFVRKTVEFFQIDQGHPHTFTKRNLEDLFARWNFKILKSKSRGYFRTWVKQLGSGKLKEIVKAMTFATADKKTFLLTPI